MIPLMQREVVERHGWLTEEEFMDQMSLSQVMPGAFAVNMATAIGYRQAGWIGGLSAVVGNVAMPICVIVLLAMFFRCFRDNSVVEHIFMGVRPAVVALIAAPVVKMARSAGLTWRNAWMPVTAALLIWLWGVSPIVILLAAAVGGVATYWLRRR